MTVIPLPIRSNAVLYRGQPEMPDLSRPFIVAPRASAGFPSPAADYIEESLNLKDLLVRNPTATYYVQVDGDSMIDVGLFHKDIAVVDRSLNPKSGSIVIAVYDGQVYIKKFRRVRGTIELHSENKEKVDIYPPLRATEGHTCEIWGVVTNGIRRL